MTALSSVLSQLFGVWRPAGGSPPRPVPFDPGQQGILWSEFRGCIRTLFRSAYIGTFVGMMPGLGVTMAGFLGYGAAKRASRSPEEFGTGRLEGIAATEAANSAVTGANLIPTIALGIPGNVAAALLIGAFIIHGITPGPFMMQTNGELVYALFASMLIANVVHLVVGRFGIPIWVQVTKAPKAIILPVVTVLCVVGVWIPSSSIFEIGVMFAFAALGYLKVPRAEFIALPDTFESLARLNRLWNRNVLVMGDLNDEPCDRSVVSELRASSGHDKIEEPVKRGGRGRNHLPLAKDYLRLQPTLFNCMWRFLAKADEGTCFYSE